MKASAPGKLFLLGEYGVLRGGRALIAAVNRRAVGERVERARASPVVREVMRAAGARTPVSIDTSVFTDGEGRKLGVGSSSAVAVVAAALATGRGDERTLSAAIHGHRAAQGGVGSGVDVAASFHGGVLASAAQPAPVEPLPGRLRGLHMFVFFSGQSASSRRLVEQAQRSDRFDAFAEQLARVAEAGIEAWRHQDVERFLLAVGRTRELMAGLGRAAGIELVGEAVEAFARAAAEHGGVVKPSGAGGGDVCLLFARDEEPPVRAEAFGLSRLDVQIERSGLRIDG